MISTKRWALSVVVGMALIFAGLYFIYKGNTTPERKAGPIQFIHIGKEPSKGRMP